jgi:hypothetical protein
LAAAFATAYANAIALRFGCSAGLANIEVLGPQESTSRPCRRRAGEAVPCASPA